MVRIQDGTAASAPAITNAQRVKRRRFCVKCGKTGMFLLAVKVDTLDGVG